MKDETPFRYRLNLDVCSPHYYFDHKYTPINKMTTDLPKTRAWNFLIQKTLPLDITRSNKTHWPNSTTAMGEHIRRALYQRLI